jgi:hypothetical protein
MEKETETLYKKVGRKYVPTAARWYEDRHADQMPVGTFRLTYAYSDGGRRYEYDVTPATAPMVAAMMVARQAMDDAISEAVKMRPSTPKPYTKKQLVIIEQFRKDMDGMYPQWWTESSGYDISSAAIKAVMDYKLKKL